MPIYYSVPAKCGHGDDALIALWYKRLIPVPSILKCKVMLEMKRKIIVSEIKKEELRKKLGDFKFEVLQRIWDAYNYLLEVSVSTMTYCIYQKNR